MPVTVKKRVLKKQNKAAGMNKKTARKTANKTIRAENGGKSQFGRVWRGAAKIGAGIVPGIGGAVLGALVAEKNSPTELPIFQAKTSLPPDTIAETQTKQADQAVVETPPVYVANTPLPAVKKQYDTKPMADVVEEQKTKSLNGGGGSGGGGGAEYDEDENSGAKSGKSFAPDPKQPPKTENKNKGLYIALGVLAGLAVLALIIKAIKK